MNLLLPLRLRYFIPFLLLLLALLQNGVKCQKDQITMESLLTANPQDDYLKQLVIHHIDNKCQLARFGFATDFFEMGFEDFAKSYADLFNPQASCPRKKHAMIVSSEGDKYFDALLNEDGYLKIRSSQLHYVAGPRTIEKSDPKDLEASNENLKDLSNCFEDLGSFYCVSVQKSKNDEGEEETETISPVFHLLRFTKKTEDAFVHTGTLNLKIRHGEMPHNVLQDSQSGHISIIYHRFGGHEDKAFDIRSLFALGDRGNLVRAKYPVQQTIGIASHNGYRYFVVYPRHKVSDKLTSGVYTFYRSAQNSLSANQEAASINWGKLAERSARRVAMFFKNALPTRFTEAKEGARRCLELMKKNSECKKEKDSLTGIQTALIIVAGVLMGIFVLLMALLLVYLLWCVQSKKRRHRRRRKHRKLRKHRKTSTDPSKAKGQSEEVEVEPGKPDEEPPQEENKVVKKIKELGGVDYSSSSSEDPEHSQAYFSARDQFDTKVSTGVNAPSSQKEKTPTNNNEQHTGISPAGNADPTSAADQPTGATPEEHDLDMVNGAKPGAPRSVYMKPKKKKK